jgi:hypothetical protein
MYVKFTQCGSKEMGYLTRKEILAELKKLGINTNPELMSYLREYYNYIFTEKYPN